MADLQKYFLDFHDAIKLKNIDENKILQEKRDMLIGKLKESLPKDVPSFSQFNQGSYAMSTGVNPKNGDYDIDVGIIFDCDSSKYNPVSIKQIVRDAITHANRKVKIRRSCVTVQYIKDGDPYYHIDLAIYVKRTQDTLLDLAKGKEFSIDAETYWDLSDPKGLINIINAGSASCFEPKDTAQMRRCIRYMKLWRDHKLLCGKPVSIALTCATQQWFSPKTDRFAKDYDLEALQNFVSVMRCTVEPTKQILLPVKPYSNLIDGMTSNQFDNFISALSELESALNDANSEDDPVEACKNLQKQFGSYFPVPEKSDTGKKSSTAAVIPSGTSAKSQFK